MPKFLVAYATTEGQTRKIATAVSEHLELLGHEARLADTADLPVGLDPANYDAFILGASLHIMAYQTSIAHFVNHHVELLNERPSAFISVSLSAVAVDPEEARITEDCARKFFDAVGWKPRAVHHAAGALRFAQYDFFKKWVLKQIAKEHGYDAAGRNDMEFTDWDALKAFVDEFVGAHSSSA